MKIQSICATLFAVFLAIPSAFSQEATFEPNQRLNLTIGGVPPQEAQQVSGVYTVSTNFTLNLPHIPEVNIRGLTRSQVQRKIESAYKGAQIYTNPNINIIADGVTVERIISVMGEVNRAGPVPYRPGMTLFEAISAAGNQTDFGSLKKIKLIRKGKVTQHDLSKISTNPGADVTLQPNDKIIVPKSKGIFDN